MADQDVIICIGSSNMAGFGANLYDVPTADHVRWTSLATPTSGTPTRPYTFQVPGVRLWTPRRPYSVNEQRAVTVGGSGTTLTYGGTAISTTADMWQFIRAGSGKGNLRRITNVASQTHTVDPALSPAVVAADTLVVLQDSHTLASLSSDGLTITKTSASPIFTSAAVGRFCSFFDSASGGETTRKIAAQTNTTLTFDQPLTAFPAAAVARTITFDGGTERVNLTAHGYVAGSPVVFEGGTPPVEVVARTVYYATNVTANDFQLATTLALALAGTNFTLTGSGSGTTTVKGTVNGFCVLGGANAVHDLATMQPPNAVLQDLTFTLDDVSPVYLTGLDYTNWDFTPFASPRALSFDPTVNSVAELSFHVKSKVAAPLVVLELGVSASMISTFPLAVSATTTLVGPLHDITSLDFSPASPQGIYEILAAAITSMRTLIEAEGNTMKVRGIFINLFDNDPVDVQRVQRLRSNAELLRDTLRTLLGDTTVPWVMSGPSAYAGGAGHPISDRVYYHLNAIAADDPNSGVVDTRRAGYTYSEDNFHLSAQSQIRLGQEFFRVWEPIHDRLVGPKGDADLVKVAMCNRALMAIGETANVTSLDPPEGSVHADKCALAFDEAAEFVTTSRHWSFANERVSLSKVALVGPIANATTNVIETGVPHGLRLGSPFSLAQTGSALLPAPLKANTTYYAVNVTALSFGVATTPTGAAIDLTTAGDTTASGFPAWVVYKESDRSAYRYMYELPADCFVERGVVPAGAPDDWPGMDGSSLGRTELGSGFVTASVSGLNQAVDATMSGERQSIPFKRAKNAAGEMVIYTDLDAAELVYTAHLDDATQWPPDWKKAVELVLTSYLCAAVKRDQKMAGEYMRMAEFAISNSARIDSQRAPIVPQNRFPFAR